MNSTKSKTLIMQTSVPSTNPQNAPDSTNTIVSQYETWCKELKCSIQEKTKYNFIARSEKIEAIVNHIISSHSLKVKSFVLSNSEKLVMLNNIKNEISKWKGVDIDSCKSQHKTYKQYRATSKNWFNQNKSRIYGDHFFAPLIFDYIFKYCMELCISNNNMKICIFIEIFDAILTENIQFPMCRSQPLLLYQSLIQSNKFKNKCKDFLVNYNIQ
eukprot:371049_1